MLPPRLDPNDPFVVNEVGTEFEDLKVRRRFVSRVFGLVSLQLVFTASFVAACLFVDDLREFVGKNKVPALIALILYIVALLTIAFSRGVRRGFLGVVCLLVLTASLAYFAAHLSAEYSDWTVLLAASVTAIISMTICFASACTNLDLTKHRVFVSFFIMFGLVCLGMLCIMKILLPDSRWIELVFASVGAILFSMSLLYEVQMVMGGRVIAVRPDEVVYATSMIYLQMIIIYQTLLMCKFV